MLYCPFWGPVGPQRKKMFHGRLQKKISTILFLINSLRPALCKGRLNVFLKIFRLRIFFFWNAGFVFQLFSMQAFDIKIVLQKPHYKVQLHLKSSDGAKIM